MSTFKAIRQILTLRCAEATELISRASDEDLPKAERVALRFHTTVCRSCRRFRKQLAAMRGLLGGLETRAADASKDADEALSQEARLRMQRLIESRQS